MSVKNSIYIATSLDGFIADKDNSIDWLNTFPPPEGSDMGFETFMNGIDALVMGRITFETVLSFGVEWPYQKPVFVWSRSETKIPKELSSKAFATTGTPVEITTVLQQKGMSRLYIDGGKTIQSFLEQDLIDEMIITTIPLLLGGGSRLFGALEAPKTFTCTHTECFNNGVVQSTFIKKTM